jgi:hypothetical protein
VVWRGIYQVTYEKSQPAPMRYKLVISNPSAKVMLEFDGGACGIGARQFNFLSPYKSGEAYADKG